MCALIGLSELAYADVNGGSSAIALDGTYKLNPSYTDVRVLNLITYFKEV